MAPPCLTRKKSQKLLIENHPALACVKRRRYRFVFVRRSFALALSMRHMSGQHRSQTSQLRCHGDFHHPPAVNLTQRHHACAYIDSPIVSITAENVVPHNHVCRARVSTLEHTELQVKRTSLMRELEHHRAHHHHRVVR